jgi:hypothetical protein
MSKLYYLIAPNDKVVHVWKIDGTVARPFSNLGDSIQLHPGESLLDALRQQPKGSVYRLAEDAQLTLEECPRQLGEYYPRIYRPVFWHEQDMPKLAPQDEQILASSLGQLVTLTEQLTRIFRVIFPAASNLCTYGHEIRNLILLACTEVEAQWKGILRANNASPAGHYFATKDYVKLLEPLKLAQYQVVLPMYPQLPPLAPFAPWNRQNPSQSLPWYAAYNAVKHDRETEFSQAKLRYAIDAVVACAVMLEAQYGHIPAWRDQLGQFFRFEKRPQWSDREKYLPPVGTEWHPTDFPFD